MEREQKKSKDLAFRRFLRFADLKRMGLVANRVTLSRWIKNGNFPPPVHLGPNVRAWPADEVDEHLERLKAEREVHDGDC